MTGFALNAFAQFTLNFTIISYAVTIFEKTGTSIDPYISSIVLALALIVGSLLTTYLADMLGRKILNIVSCAGSAIGLFTLSIYYYFYINDYNLASFVWVPVVSLSFVVFISSAGINALAYVCSVECIPAKVNCLVKFINAFVFSIVCISFTDSNLRLCNHLRLDQRYNIYLHKIISNFIGNC